MTNIRGSAFDHMVAIRLEFHVSLFLSMVGIGLRPSLCTRPSASATQALQ